MEPSYRPDISEQRQEIQPTVQLHKRPKFKKLLRLIQKFWYIVIILIIVLSGLITWFLIQSSQNSTWERATDAFTRADYDKAEKELSNIAMPTTADHLRVYAQTMLATQHLDKSLPAYQKLYEINKDPSIKLVIGNIYNQQKKYSEAIKIYSEVIANNTGNVQAYINLSTVYKLQNNASDAIKTANNGVKSNPGSITLHELQVSMLMDDKKSEAYIAAVAELKALNPADPLIQALNE